MKNMKKELQEKLLFRSSDISLCSALCCFGYTIDKIERQDNGRAIFLMKKDEKIDGLIKQYFDHELKVDALSFFNYLKEIKTQIYNLG